MGEVWEKFEVSGSGDSRFIIGDPETVRLLAVCAEQRIKIK
jgi:hypothetical protein